MNSDLKDILSNSNKDIDNQKLMDYLTNELSKAESHNLEKDMAEDEFLNDAVEGLQKVESKRDLQAYVEQLNAELLKQTAKNKKRKDKRKLKDQPYTYITILIILILIIIGFIIIKRNMDARPASTQRTSAAIENILATSRL